jgi:hypothetical protein
MAEDSVTDPPVARWERELAASEGIRIARALEAGELRRARAMARRLTETQKRLIGRWGRVGRRGGRPPS